MRSHSSLHIDPTAPYPFEGRGFVGRTYHDPRDMLIKLRARVLYYYATSRGGRATLPPEQLKKLLSLDGDATSTDVELTQVVSTLPSDLPAEWVSGRLVLGRRSKTSWSEKPIDDWSGVRPRQKWMSFPYPESFESIWSMWRKTAQRNDHVRAVGKANAYRCCLRWRHEGVSPEQLEGITREYLSDYYRDPEKSHCLMPATLYSTANPTVPDRISELKPAMMMSEVDMDLQRWDSASAAWSDCERLARHIGLTPIPERPDPNYPLRVTLSDVKGAWSSLMIHHAFGTTQPPSNLLQQLENE